MFVYQAHWGSVAEGCNGDRQSPIDITYGLVEPLKAPAYPVNFRGCKVKINCCFQCLSVSDALVIFLFVLAHRIGSSLLGRRVIKWTFPRLNVLCMYGTMG